MEQPPVVVGLGAINLDYFYRVERLLGDGEGEVKDVRSFPGGSAANTIYALARLGVPCGFVGAVGGDDAGQRLVSNLASVGVDTRHIVVKDAARTGSVVALVDSQGHRALYVHPGANSLLQAKDVESHALQGVEWLHTSAFVGQIQLRLQKELVAQLPESIRISFAPGALYARRGLEAMGPLLEQTFILFINRKELKELTGADLEAGAAACLQAGCRVVVVTLGRGLRRGRRRCCCLIGQADGMDWVEGAPGPHIVIDTTGAGDAFAAGFLYSLILGQDWTHCGLLGDLMAGYCIRQMGARPGLPTLPELAQAYEQITGQTLER